MSRRPPSPRRRRTSRSVAQTGPTPETLAKLKPDLLRLLVASGVIGEVDVEALVDRRNGENGNGLGVAAMRYWPVILVIGGMIAAGAAGQVQIVNAAEERKEIKAAQKALQEHLRNQAQTNGQIDERTKAIQRQLETLIDRLDRQARNNER